MTEVGREPSTSERGQEGGGRWHDLVGADHSMVVVGWMGREVSVRVRVRVRVSYGLGSGRY